MVFADVTDTACVTQHPKIGPNTHMTSSHCDLNIMTVKIPHYHRQIRHTTISVDIQQHSPSLATPRNHDLLAGVSESYKGNGNTGSVTNHTGLLQRVLVSQPLPFSNSAILKKHVWWSHTRTLNLQTHPFQHNNWCFVHRSKRHQH